VVSEAVVFVTVRVVFVTFVTMSPHIEL